MHRPVFEKFRTVIIAGACFEESMMHLLWSNPANPNFEVQFEDWSHKFALRYNQHRNGGLIDIYYGVNAPWSKNLRNSQVLLKDGREATVYDAIRNRAKEMLDGEKVAEFLNTTSRGLSSKIASGFPTFPMA
jgi:hypothetical protein